MHFLYPTFLYGLIGLMIPLLIHLFNFRKHKLVYFSDIRLLKNLVQETQKVSKLKHLLVLISRLLMWLFLVLAFAHPYFANNKEAVMHGENLVSIYIDNSYSMEAAGEQGNLLNTSIKKAKEIVAQYSPADKFRLVTNDFEVKHRPWLSREDCLEMLSSIKLSASSSMLSEVMRKVFTGFDSQKDKNKIAFVLSDFQKTTADLANLPKDTDVRVDLIPINSLHINNVYLDSCWINAPILRKGQTIEMFCRIKNASDQDIEKIPLKLIINQKQKAAASVDLKAGQQKDIALHFTPDEVEIQQGNIEITDFPIVYDDKLFFSFKLIQKIHILSINQSAENPYIARLFKSDSVFNVTNYSIGNVDYESLKQYDLILFNGVNSIPGSLADEVGKLISQGQSVFFFPGSQCESSISSFIQKITGLSLEKPDTTQLQINGIHLYHSLYKDVFDQLPPNPEYPVLHKHYPFKKSSLFAGEPFLTAQNGDIAGCSFNHGKGIFYLVSFPADPSWSSLQDHVLWVPTLLNAAINSLSRSELYYEIKTPCVLQLNHLNLGGESLIKIRNEDGYEAIPSYRNIENTLQATLEQAIPEAGNYMIWLDGAPYQGISFNYNRLESDRQMLGMDDIQKSIKEKNLTHYHLLDAATRNITKEMLTNNDTTDLWKICVLLSILFILIEVVLIRFLR